MTQENEVVQPITEQTEAPTETKVEATQEVKRNEIYTRAT